MITRYDKCIIALFLCLSVLFFSVFALKGKESSRILNIYSDGSLYATYKLDELNKAFEEKIENKRGSLTVYISGEKCFVQDADCKDKLCKKQHPINDVNQTITCLPNRILIEIVSEKLDEKVDMVAF